MANSGYTTTSSLSDSLDDVVAAARVVREYEGVMPRLVDRQTLKPGTGLTWNEITLGQLTAQAVSETTVLNNPQQMQDTKFSLTPTSVGIHTFITDRVRDRIAREAYTRLGKLAGDAITRKKDEDGLVVLDGFTSLSGAGTTLQSGIIVAAQARIAGNTTESAPGPYACVLHPFQKKDLADELMSGIGTYPVPAGDTSTVFRTGFRLPIAGVDVFDDGNISIDSADDAKGGVFAKQGIVLVEGHTIRREDRREPDIGGGGTSVWLYDEYIYGERLAAGTTSAWGYEIYSDATAPSS